MAHADADAGGLLMLSLRLGLGLAHGCQLLTQDVDPFHQCHAYTWRRGLLNLQQWQSCPSPPSPCCDMSCRLTHPTLFFNAILGWSLRIDLNPWNLCQSKAKNESNLKNRETRCVPLAYP